MPQPSNAQFVASTLTNDEASSDEELVEHFMGELKVDRRRASRLVAMRQQYLLLALDQYLLAPDPSHEAGLLRQVQTILEG